MTTTTTTALDAAYDKAAAGERLTEADGLLLLEHGDLLTLGSLANAARQRHLPGRIVTYIVDRNVNYSNSCVTYCAFCAFYRPPGHSEVYVQTYEQIGRRLEELAAQDGRQVLLQGGHHPDLTIDWYVGLLRYIRERFPAINIHGFSPPELTHFAEIWKMPVAEILRVFREAGLGSVPGGGAEILVDRVRDIIAPKKVNTKEWLGVMREAHRLGISTTATMMYGHVETLAERVEHLRRIRELQDETHGFRAFISWTYQDDGNRLGALVPVEQRPTSFDYLLTQAVSRIFLDNVDHIQSSWVTQGMKIGQVALEFGADDMGSVMIEENVVSAAGTTYRTSTDELVHLIRSLGKIPVQRDTLYRDVRVWN